MPITSLLLVIFAAFLHACWNLMAKRAAGAGAVFVFAYAITATVFYAPLALWVVATSTVSFTPIMLAAVTVSAFVHIAYSLSLQRGYQVADLSVVYPIARGTGPLLSTFGAILLLGEPAQVSGIAGMLLVVSGIVLIASDGRLSTFLSPGSRTGIRWGVQTGLLIAAYTVFDAYSVKVLMIAPILLDWVSNVLRSFFLLPYALRKGALKGMKGYWWLAAGVGALSPLSYILVLYALELGAPLSLVAPAREMSMMIGTFFGIFILKENAGPWRVMGCVILLCGVVLLGLS